jgi:hypothetical protein
MMKATRNLLLMFAVSGAFAFLLVQWVAFVSDIAGHAWWGFLLAFAPIVIPSIMASIAYDIRHRSRP